MSQAGVRALLDRVESDEGFRDRLLAEGSIEERGRLVLEAGYDVEPSDLPAFKEMSGFSELTDEELEWVAGGGTGTEVGVGIATAVTGGAAGIGILAAVIAASFC